MEEQSELCEVVIDFQNLRLSLQDFYGGRLFPDEHVTWDALMEWFDTEAQDQTLGITMYALIYGKKTGPLERFLLKMAEEYDDFGFRVCLVKPREGEKEVDDRQMVSDIKELLASRRLKTLILVSGDVSRFGDLISETLVPAGVRTIVMGFTEYALRYQNLENDLVEFIDLEDPVRLPQLFKNPLPNRLRAWALQPGEIRYVSWSDIRPSGRSGPRERSDHSQTWDNGDSGMHPDEAAEVRADFATKVETDKLDREFPEAVESSPRLVEEAATQVRTPPTARELKENGIKVTVATGEDPG